MKLKLFSIRPDVNLGVAAACVCFTWLAVWSGCDFQEVGSDTGGTVDDMVKNLATAQTPDAAQSAIEALFRKTGTGYSYTPSLYMNYKLDDSGINSLASAQAKFNSGDIEAGSHAGRVYELVQATDHPTSVELGVALEAVDELAELALADPGTASNLILVVVISESASIPKTVNPMTEDRVLSPVQAFLLGMWLHKQGPSLILYKANGHAGPPEKIMICHKPGTPAQKTLFVPLSALGGHLGHGDSFGECTVEICTDVCEDARSACLLSGKSGALCEQKFEECAGRCHDQGGGS